MLVGGGDRIAFGQASTDGGGVRIAKGRPVQAQRIAAAIGERSSDGVERAAHDVARAGRTQAGQVHGGGMALERGERAGGERMLFGEGERHATPTWQLRL
jgi:hypothetical protein